MADAKISDISNNSSPATSDKIEVETSGGTSYHETIKQIVAVGVAAQFWVSAAGGWPSTTSGCANVSQTELSSNKVNFKSLDFDAATQEYAEWNFCLPADYDGGTITAKFFWLANDTTTNSVIWGLQGRCYGDGDALDQAMGTAQEVTDANASTANQVRISAASSAITLGGTPAANKLCQFRVYRKAADGSDTLTVDAKLIGFQVTYTRA